MRTTRRCRDLGGYALAILRVSRHGDHVAPSHIGESTRLAVTGDNRLGGHRNGDVSSTAMKGQVEIGLGRDVPSYPLWYTVGERLAWRQRCSGLVTHTVCPACLHLGGNSQDSLLPQRLHQHWGLRARPTSTHAVGSSGEGAPGGHLCGARWPWAPLPGLGTRTKAPFTTPGRRICAHSAQGWQRHCAPPSST